MGQFEWVKKKKDIRHISHKECNRKKLYNSVQWRNTSQFYKQEHPLCELCLLEDKVSPGENVHHIQKFNDQIREDLQYSLLTDPDNLCNVCLDCHHKIHNGGKELTEKQRNWLKTKKERLFSKYLKEGLVIILTNDKNNLNSDK